MQQLRSAIHNAIARFLKISLRARIIAVGFALLILLGAALLMLPFAVHPGAHVGPLDALFTATSAVCVTGLVVVDTGDTFSLFGQAVIAILIQIGGLGVASIGMGLALVAGRRISKGPLPRAGGTERREPGGHGTPCAGHPAGDPDLRGRRCGAQLPSFARDHMPLQAVWLSIFHSTPPSTTRALTHWAAAEPDPLSERSAAESRHRCARHCGRHRLHGHSGRGACRGQFRRMAFHTKVVLSTTAVLLVGGAVLLQLTDHMGWLAALFQSMTARTAGFSSVDVGSISNAGLLVIMILMFIGASPGSTGGGIKTTTFFVLMQQVRSIFSKRRLGGFHRRLPDGSLSKAATIMLMGADGRGCGTFALCVLEPQLDFGRLLFEQISAYSTAGLSTGITAELCPASRVVLILTMFIGRVGAVTLLSLWLSAPSPPPAIPKKPLRLGKYEAARQPP